MSEGQAPPQRPPPPEKEDSASSNKSGAGGRFGFRSMMDSVASEATKVSPKVQLLGGRLKNLAPQFPSRSSHSHSDETTTPDAYAECSQPQETVTRNQDDQDEEGSANSSEEEGAEEDYAAMLENMDIDGDFTAWTSFRQSVRTLQVEDDDGGGNSNDHSMIPPTISEDSSSTYNEPNELAKWKARYEHLPVFSKYYQPTPQERKEMDELKQLLGISRLIPASHMEKGVAELWSDQDGQPQSILLKRGPVAFQKEERELILVTRGLILATVQDKKRGAWGRGGWIRRTFEQYIPLHTISKVLDGSLSTTNEHGEHDPTSLTLQTSSVDSNSMDPVVSWTFTCASVPHRAAWLEALQVAVVQAHLLHETKWVADENLHLGWKHRVMCSSLYTAAILGNANMMNELLIVSTNVNAPDDDGISALHYATRYMQLDCMETLLEAKANPNVLDTDSHTPMYYAVEANYQPAVDLLFAFGAAPYDNGGGSDDEGELFGKVAQKHAMNQEQKQVAKAEAAAAEAAKNVMAENMQLMKERGEKLENMDDKASQVRKDAEEMKQLSQQLKEKMKKKNTWFGL